MTLYVFYFLSFLAVLSALMVVFSRNPVYSVLYLVITFFCVGGHYLILSAEFLFAVHIIVYAGAIMVLFLYVIMLLNLNKEDEPHKPILSKIAATISFCLVGFVLLGVFIKAQPIITDYTVSGEDYQSIKVLGKVLLNEYMVPFEFASVLLLVSMIGAVLVSKKEKQLS